MKTTNIFDMLDTEPTVTDNTVIIDTGVNTQKVTQLVKEAITMDNSKVIPMKKKSKTAFRLTALIAAVIAASIVTASAMGGFHQVFGSLFAGESSDGIYSGSDIVVESNTTNVDFLGIAGDEYMAAASMKLNRPDGEKFIDNIENTWISASSDPQAEHPAYVFGYIPDDIYYTCPKWFSAKYPTEMQGNQRTDVHSTFGFYFDDCSTISGYIFSTTSYGAIKGETLTASVDSLSAYTAEEILYDYSEHIADNTDEYGFVTNPDFYKTIRALLNDSENVQKDGLLIMVNPETHDIVLAKETPLDISFSLSVKMNYKNSSNIYKLSNLAQSCKSWQNGAEGKATVTPFNMILDVDVPDPVVMTYDTAIDELRGSTGLLAYSEAMDEYPDELKVTLANGETVWAYEEGYVGDTFWNNNKYQVIFQFYTQDTGDGTRIHPIAINPDDISTIEARDTVIYSK